MDKERLTKIIEKCLNDGDVRSDFEVLLPIIKVNAICSEELTLYLNSIGINIEFFKKELNYPLQLFNLLLFELDAREIKTNRGRGSEYRMELIKTYKKLIL